MCFSGCFFLTCTVHVYIQYIHFCYVHVAGLLETTIENMKCLHTKAMVKLEEHSSSKRKVGRECAECI